MKFPQIKEIDYGIAYCVNNGNKKWIEMNKNLKFYPKLYKRVLAHELQHLKSKNKHMDFLIDFKETFKFDKELTLFCLKHPRTLLSFSPLFYEKRKWSVNWFMVLVNLVFVVLIVGGIILI